jgi:glyoxylase-like metal-dependent hydrolase (beta-lactamase superfamily II)
MSRLEPLLPHISLCRDACNVYVLQCEDGNTYLFDLGSGAVLQAMAAAGLPAPQMVMHTDYRRDRTFGHHDHPGLPVVLGEHDAPFMAGATQQWESLEVFHGYAGYERFWMPRESIPVARVLKEGELAVWSKPYVYAQRIGGHTPGGLGYLVVDEGRRYLIGGDVLQADGTLHSIYELQRTYNFMEGLHAVRRTVGWLASGDIEALLPAHGEPILGAGNVQAAANTLLARIADFWERWRLIWPDQPQGHVSDFAPVTVALPSQGAGATSIPQGAGACGVQQAGPAPGTPAVLPHLRGATNIIQYAIVDDDGNAVLFDTGTGYPEGFEQVLEAAGIRNVDVAFITHHHDDHVMGFQWLKDRYNTRLATHESMVDVLRNPKAYALNCLHDQPLEVDVILREGEPYLWRGYEVRAHHFPSQTEYHCVYFAEVDGVMTLFSGDALYWEPGAERIRPTDPDWRNKFNVDTGYLKGAHLLRQVQPRLLAAAHVHPWPITEAACNEFEANAQAFHDSLRALVGRQHAALGIDPFLVSVYPYRAELKARMHVEVRLDNPLDRPVVVELTPRLPAGLRAMPEVLEVELGPGEHARVPLTLVAEEGLEPRKRRMWTLRVVFDGEDLGEHCEAMLETPGE